MKSYATNPRVSFYFEKDKPWHKEIRLLRTLPLECGLEEDLKWGCPTYTLQGNNVVLIHTFKHYCALLFMKGALIHDTAGLLIQQTKNVQAARQLRFTSAAEIVKHSDSIKQYIQQAIEIEKAGLKVALKKTTDYEIPAKFEKKLNQSRTLKSAFQALTPGRQRAYLFYFAQAKQAKTREARVEKSIPRILSGKGIDD